MFTAGISPVPFTPPWDRPFEERLARLRRGSPRAAYFFERPDTSTFRYRVYNVAQALEPTGASASWFDYGELDAMDRVLDECDVLVIGRAMYNHRIGRMVAQARARGRRVLFDVDDLVFDLAYAHTLIDSLNEYLEDGKVWEFWYGAIARIGTAMQLCDGAVVTNGFLAERAAAFLNKPVRIIPNALNREQEEVSARIWDAKARSGWARNGLIHLGYFSGSHSHRWDFALAAPTLARLMDEDDRLHLRIGGYLDGIGPDLQRHLPRIERVPFQDPWNLQRTIGGVEVNLVPLQDNVFTNCKSELKWFEAAAVGTLTVASPTYAYRHAIAHGTEGWLAPAQDWDRVLRQVLADEAAWPGVREAARAKALDRFGWRNQAGAIQAALFEGW